MGKNGKVFCRDTGLKFLNKILYIYIKYYIYIKIYIYIYILDIYICIYIKLLKE